MKTYGFIALVEVKPLVGCQFDKRNVCGAVVRCYVWASNKKQAVVKIGAALDKDRFEVINIEWLVDADAVDWDHANDTTEDKNLAKAKTLCAVIQRVSLLGA